MVHLSSIIVKPNIMQYSFLSHKLFSQSLWYRKRPRKSVRSIQTQKIYVYFTRLAKYLPITPGFTAQQTR